MTSSTSQAWGLVALVSLGLVAGFLVASTANGEVYTTVGEVSTPQAAFALPLEGERLRFTLDAQPGALDPSATFLLFDPEDQRFGTFTVTDEEHVDTVTDEAGTWVVLVAETRGANLVIQVGGPEDQATEPPRMTPLRVITREETVARQQGGPLDTQLGIRVTQPPDLALLETRADARGLQATVKSPVGPVYHLDHERTNTTDRGASQVHGTQGPTPEHLVTGTYTVTAQAERFSGTLSLLLLTYDRSGLEPQNLAPIPTNATLEELLSRGTTVAEMTDGQTVAVESQGARRLLVVTPANTVARLIVYDPGDRALGTFQVGHDPERSFSFGQEPGTNATAQGLHIPLVRGGEYVVHLDRVYGETERVYLVLPGTEDAEVARELATADRTVALGDNEPGTGSQDSREIALDGGLIAVRVEDDSPVDASEHTLVSGPRGRVFEHVVSAGLAGFSTGEEAERVPEHFSSGTFEVRWTSSAPLDGTKVVFTSYHR